MSNYWAALRAQAWTEAKEQIRWDTPLRVATSFGPSAASFLATWFLTKEVAVGVAVAVLTLVGLGLGTFLVKLAALPPILAAQSDAERRRLETMLASYVDPEDEVDLRSGAAYAVHRVWGRSLWEDEGNHFVALGDVLEQIRRLAHKSRIHVWGQTGPHSVHQVIDPEWWIDGRVDLLSVTKADEEPVRTDKHNRLNPPRWNDLRVNRAEFEREWPPIA